MLFNLHASDVALLLDRHREINASVAPTDEERNELKQIERAIKPYLKVMPVDPTDTAVVKQLVGYDAVHKFGAQSVEDLVKMRVGAKGDNKVAMALVNTRTTNNVPEVLAVIYVYKHAAPIACNDDIPGNIAEILNTPCQPLQGELTGLIFYSISNMLVEGTKTPLLKGAGEMLIEGLFPYFAAEGISDKVVLSTLSPLRTLPIANPGRDLHALKPFELAHLAVQHLLLRLDPVERFHMNNGARAGSLKLYPNKRGTQDDLAMVNYIYNGDPAVRASNRAAFKAAAKAGPEAMKPLIAENVLQHFSPAISLPPVAVPSNDPRSWRNLVWERVNAAAKRLTGYSFA